MGTHQPADAGAPSGRREPDRPVPLAVPAARRSGRRRRSIVRRILHSTALVLAAALLLGGAIGLRMRTDMADARQHMTGEDIIEVEPGATGRYRGVEWRLTRKPTEPDEPIAGGGPSEKGWVQVEGLVEVTGDPAKIDLIARDAAHRDKGFMPWADFADSSDRRWSAVPMFVDVYRPGDSKKQPITMRVWGDVPKEAADDLDILITAERKDLDVLDLEPGEAPPWRKSLLLRH